MTFLRRTKLEREYSSRENISCRSQKRSRHVWESWSNTATVECQIIDVRRWTNFSRTINCSLLSYFRNRENSSPSSIKLEDPNRGFWGTLPHRLRSPLLPPSSFTTLGGLQRHSLSANVSHQSLFMKSAKADNTVSIKTLQERVTSFLQHFENVVLCSILIGTTFSPFMTNPTRPIEFDICCNVRKLWEKFKLRKEFSNTRFISLKCAGEKFIPKREPWKERNWQMILRQWAAYSIK